MIAMCLQALARFGFARFRSSCAIPLTLRPLRSRRLSLSRGEGIARGVALVVAILATPFVFSGEAETKPAEKPAITNEKGEIGELLRKWYAEGTAAGNVGDYYDNRDREHSGLNMKPYPQLQRIQYSKKELDARFDWALFSGVRAAVTMGNSSTSAPAHQGGSNPRRAYATTRGLENLYEQYTHNNLYIYPEHRDHDPGHNGVNDGYGDVFPTNTPFVIISQGSSGTDQPFMRAVPFTLAAFRPEVKRKLVASGLLMPTVQMIFRYSNSHLTDPAKEYLSGKAHPTVFEGSAVNALKMVKLANEITEQTIPPLVKLTVVEEDKPKDGLDFFEPGATEVLADTPAVIARVFRGRQFTRRMIVSAAESVDLNKRTLQFHWVVLRGDPERIKIERKDPAGSSAEIKVSYHERRPIAPGSAMESNRVDIGVFAHNGTYYSAPSFITYFFLDHEARAYDEQQRILEIGYKTGETTIGVANWQALFGLLSEDVKTWPAQLLREQFKPDELEALRKAAAEYAPLSAAVNESAAQRKAAQAEFDKARAAAEKAAEAEKAAAVEARKAADEKLKAAQKTADAAGKALADFLNAKREGLPAAIQTLFDQVLKRWLHDPEFMFKHAAQLNELAASNKAHAAVLAKARTQLARYGMAGKDGLQLLRSGAGPAASSATAFEQAILARENGDVLAAMFSTAVNSAFRANYVQPEISEPPYWRDVYRYHANGQSAGWLRYGDEQVKEFNADGLLVLEKDAQGRCVKAQTMTYEPVAAPADARWPHWRPTKQIPGGEIRIYAYESDADVVGKVSRVEKVSAPAEKK